MSKQVVVLGMGMVGTGTALALQARGYDVLLLDRAKPGSETSYGNAGVIQGEACEPYALPRDLGTLFRIALKIDNSVDWDILGLWRFLPAFFPYWFNSAPSRHREISNAYAMLIQRCTRDHAGLISASSSENMIRREGYRLVFRDPASFERQTRKAEQLRALYGVNHVIEDSAALAAAEPALLRPLAGAIHWQDAWACDDPGDLVNAYARLFAQRGGELLNAELQGLEQAGEGWRVRSTAGPIDAGHVVVALGPWSPQFLAPLGYRINMIRKRGYHMNYAYPHANGRASHSRLNGPLIDAAFGAVYAPMRAGLRITSGADLSVGRIKPFPRQLRRARAAAGELVEIGAPIEDAAWCGVRPCMPDMMPLVGAAPRHRGLWFNFGHGHQGFTLGPTTGNLLAAAMDGDSDPVGLPFVPSRLVLS